MLSTDWSPLEPRWSKQFGASVVDTFRQIRSPLDQVRAFAEQVQGTKQQEHCIVVKSESTRWFAVKRQRSEKLNALRRNGGSTPEDPACRNSAWIRSVFCFVASDFGCRHESSSLPVVVASHRHTYDENRTRNHTENLCEVVSALIAFFVVARRRLR